MLWFLIFFSSLSLGNCWFWSHDRWQNSQATIKCDTHHPPLRYLQTQNMGCPLSNLFDMWTFCSSYGDTWFRDILMHFISIKTGEDRIKTHFFSSSWKLDVDDLHTHDDMTKSYWDSDDLHTIYWVRGVVSTVMLRPSCKFTDMTRDIKMRICISVIVFLLVTCWIHRDRGH